MLTIHGNMLVRTFKQAMRDTYGLGIKVHRGFSRGQFADDDGTLAAARSGQAAPGDVTIELRATMTVHEAEDTVRQAAGFAIQVLDRSGANAPNDARLSDCGFTAGGATPAGEAAAAGISVTGQKKLSTIQSEFTRRFPQLGLMFFSIEEAGKAGRGEQARPLPSDQTVASVRTKAAKGDMSIGDDTRVGALESGFRDDYGLHVQVCYMRDGKPVYTGDSLDGATVSDLNRRAGELGRGPFAYPKH